ncbi:MAG: hypothetical protein NBV63_01185 [Candidatus Pacebacteria bacterium]|nr:hypothetical protein [Candidatus Paceibacterota bacterium]
MLTICIGDDVVKAKAAVAARSAGSEMVRFGEGGLSFAEVGGYLEQRGMFAPAVTLILDRPFESEEGSVLMTEHGDLLVAASAQVFAIVGRVTATDQKKFPKGASIETFDLPARFEPEAPNSFALVDAVQAGDRKRAWILYRQLMDSGASAEEVHGTLAWAARAVVLAARTKSASEAGMKPFPYDKAKRVARALKPGEAEAQSSALVRMYHEARLGRGTLEDLLEMYLLKK